MIIEVGMADMKISTPPHTLVTRGLGSCVGITLYDPHKKRGGLAHAMLPCFAMAKIKTNPFKFVDSVIPLMFEELKKQGCKMEKLEVKLFGGAHMFSSIPMDSSFNIGAKNIKTAYELLDKYNISVIAEDTGGNYGRTIFFDLSTGKVKVRTIFFGEKEL